MILLSAVTLVCVSAVGAAQAHDWAPTDGSYGYTSGKGCDGPSLDNQWPFNDGNVCYKPWYYDHTDHLHIDHIVMWFNKNQTGQSDWIDSITNQTVSIYAGNCDADPNMQNPSFPGCYNDGYVTGPVCSAPLQDMTAELPSQYVHNSGCWVHNAHASVVIDYTAHGTWHDPSTGRAQLMAYRGQEEVHLG